MTTTLSQTTDHDRRDSPNDAAMRLARDWATNARWAGISRSYTAADVVRLRGSLIEEHTLAGSVPRSCGDCSGIARSFEVLAR